MQDPAPLPALVSSPLQFDQDLLEDPLRPLLVRWLEGQGGLAAVEKRNAEKAALVYGAML